MASTGSSSECVFYRPVQIFLLWPANHWKTLDYTNYAILKKFLQPHLIWMRQKLTCSNCFFISFFSFIYLFIYKWSQFPLLSGDTYLLLFLKKNKLLLLGLQHGTVDHIYVENKPLFGTNIQKESLRSHFTALQLLLQNWIIQLSKCT